VQSERREAAQPQLQLLCKFSGCPDLTEDAGSLYQDKKNKTWTGGHTQHVKLLLVKDLAWGNTPTTLALAIDLIITVPAT